MSRDSSEVVDFPSDCPCLVPVSWPWCPLPAPRMARAGRSAGGEWGSSRSSSFSPFTLRCIRPRSQSTGQARPLRGCHSSFIIHHSLLFIIHHSSLLRVPGGRPGGGSSAASSAAGKSVRTWAAAGLFAGQGGAGSSAGPRRACFAAPSRWGRRTAGPARSGTSGRCSPRPRRSPSASRRTPTFRHIRLLSELRMSATSSGSPGGSARGFSSTRRGESSRMPAAAREAPSPACAPVDQRLQQAVRGQPVGAVQAGGS